MLHFLRSKYRSIILINMNIIASERRFRSISLLLKSPNMLRKTTYFLRLSFRLKTISQAGRDKYPYAKRLHEDDPGRCVIPGRKSSNIE